MISSILPFSWRVQQGLEPPEAHISIASQARPQHVFVPRQRMGLHTGSSDL